MYRVTLWKSVFLHGNYRLSHINHSKIILKWFICHTPMIKRIHSSHSKTLVKHPMVIYCNLKSIPKIESKLKSLVIVAHSHTMIILVGGLEHLLFSIIYGIILPIDYDIFQRGWNHQPDNMSSYIASGWKNWKSSPNLSSTEAQKILDPECFTTLPEVRMSSGMMG